MKKEYVSHSQYVMSHSPDFIFGFRYTGCISILLRQNQLASWDGWDGLKELGIHF
jgi:hypothetical protein